MRRIEIFSTAFFALLELYSVRWCAASEVHSVDDSLLEELIALERSALDRWVKLDPQGYLARYGAEITYFDPCTEKRVDGLEAMRARLAPVKTAKLPFQDPRYEIVDPNVQRLSDVAVLTFQVINYGKIQEQPESVLARTAAGIADATVSHLVTNQQMLALPLNGRTFTSLVLLTPGAYVGSSNNLTISP